MASNPLIMEQIAMYMVGLPCPPLPVSLDVETFVKPRKKGPSEETTTVANIQVCSTHDLLAGLILSAMQRNNKVLNDLRKIKQLAITKEFLITLDKLDQKDTDSMYNACQVFTCQYIMSFDDPSFPTPSLRLHTMDFVEKNDKVHLACCSWNAGQDIMHEEQVSNRRTAKTFSLLSYRDLINVHCSRVKASPILPQTNTGLEAQ
jgi:hypothetical protein